MSDQPYTILVVDDEAPLRRVLERSLTGLTAGEMRLSLSPEDALARVVHQFLTPAGARVSVS